MCNSVVWVLDLNCNGQPKGETNLERLVNYTWRKITVLPFVRVVVLELSSMIYLSNDEAVSTGGWSNSIRVAISNLWEATAR